MCIFIRAVLFKVMVILYDEVDLNNIKDWILVWKTLFWGLMKWVEMRSDWLICFSSDNFLC